MDPIRPLPEGTVTFLFTDIEGSTRLLQRLGGQYAAVREEHRRLLREAFQAGAGQELGTEGDSFFVVFPTAPGALGAAVAAQRALVAHPWPEGAPVRVRMGLHTGTPTLTLGEYVGLDVHRAARISAAGHGGQILLSQTTRDLVEQSLPPGVSLRDLGSHRLKDLQHPEHLFQVVLPELPGDFPPPRSLEVAAHNLPIQLTHFIGREAEMAELTRLLADTRLLTLTGAGGCGKTRLGLQVAAEQVEAYADGVWLVELAALADPGLVPQAVAAALGVREEPGRSLTETMADSLRAKRSLLVLDNCEHLVAACAELVEGLLRVCGGLRVLATSREPLGIPGETAWRVPSLSVPEPGHPLPTGASAVAALTQYEAVRLFIDRARLSRPGFAVTQSNAPSVAQVCQRLDGIPLAIELAAARAKVLSAEQIVQRLDDRFRLLTGGSRTALPRQQTLRATIDWSYDLLSEAEQVLLRRLTVFAGGFTLEAAEAIGAADGVDGVAECEVLDLLGRLVDKSLVQAGEQGGAARYRLLETIRQYGEERLRESEEAAILRGRHRDWFLALAERAEPGLEGPDQRQWLDRLEVEHDNLRAALRWSLEGEGADAGLRLAGALGHFWEMRGHLTEARDWLEKGLKRSTEGSAPALARALTAAGTIASRRGDHERSVELHREALALYRELGEEQGIAFSLNNLGAAAIYQEDYERAVPFLKESLTHSRELGNKRLIAYAVHNLAEVARSQRDYGQAMELYKESLSLFREIGDKWCVCATLNPMGTMMLHQGDEAGAWAIYRDSLVLCQELMNRFGIAESLEGIAGIACMQAEPARAARLLGTAEALREAIRAPLPSTDRADYESNVAAARAALSEEAFAAAWAQGRAMALEEAIADASRPARPRLT